MSCNKSQNEKGYEFQPDNKLTTNSGVEKVAMDSKMALNKIQNDCTGSEPDDVAALTERVKKIEITSEVNRSQKQIESVPYQMAPLYQPSHNNNPVMYPPAPYQPYNYAPTPYYAYGNNINYGNNIYEPVADCCYDTGIANWYYYQQTGMAGYGPPRFCDCGCPLYSSPLYYESPYRYDGYNDPYYGYYQNVRPNDPYSGGSGYPNVFTYGYGNVDENYYGRKFELK